MIRQTVIVLAALLAFLLPSFPAVASDAAKETKAASVPIDDRTKAAIAGNLALIEKKFGDKASLDLTGVTFFDGFIGRMPKALRDKPGGLVGVIGSHLGETMVKTYKGRWIKTPDGFVGVRMGPMFDGGTELTAFPFAKVGKQFANGPEDSILSFFRIADRLLKEKASATKAK